MNIISNNCIGGHLYREMGIEPENPFIWHIIDFEDYIYLLYNYNNINFNKYNIVKRNRTEKDSLVKGYLKYPLYGINIDDKINIWFIHIIEDKECDKPVINKVKIGTANNVFCSNPEERIRDNYERRVKRMKDKPIFIFHSNRPDLYSDIHLDRLRNSSESVYIIKDTDDPKNVAKKHLNSIKEKWEKRKIKE